MPPKTVFKKEDVINAGFKIVKENGIKVLTARKVAKKLNSSVVPVYSNFESMEKLSKEVLKKAKDLLFEYITKTYTDRVFLNIGVGIAVFARDEKMLFRAIFLENESVLYKDIVDEFIKSMRVQMKKDRRFTKMTEDERSALLNKMWIFTHGLASLICVGLVEDDSNEYVTEILLDVGSAVIGKALEESKMKRNQS